MVIACFVQASNQEKFYEKTFERKSCMRIFDKDFLRGKTKLSLNSKLPLQSFCAQYNKYRKIAIY